MRCIVGKCKSNNDGPGSSGCSFFTFPSDGATRKKWTSFCQRKKKFKENSAYICSLHFTEEDFENNLQYAMGFCSKRRLKSGAVPSINPATSLGKSKLFEQRAARIEKRENKKTVAALLKEHTSCPDLQKEDEISPPLNEFENVLIENFDSAEDNFEMEEVENIPPNPKVDEPLMEDLKSELESFKKENQSLKKLIQEHATEIEKLQKIHAYEKEEMRKRLKKSNYQLKNLEENLERIFTKGQISKLKSNLKRETWTEADIAQSITPLSGARTLQNWDKKIRIKLRETSGNIRKRKKEAKNAKMG